MAAGKRTKRVRRPAREAGTNAEALAKQARRSVRRTGKQVERQARVANREIKKGAGNIWLERAARLGYVVRGLLYGAMGAFAMGFALGVWHQTTDQRGALYLLRTQPEVEIVVLGAVIVGLAGYALWGFIRAIYDPLRRGNEPQGIVARLGFAWSGLSYAGLLVFTVEFLFGLSKGNGSDSIEKPVRFLLAHPFGVYLTGIVGVVAILVGLGQFLDAAKGKWMKDLQLRKMSKEEEAVAAALGRFGFVARGIIFAMLGWFVVLAAIHHDAARAEGMGAAFQHIAEQQHGHLLLFVVASGFVALGLHSLACAKWIRMSPRN
ncbi:MAG: DUF1206 domain-containing protein [Candidatus Dormibacteraeota bacterium]|nr:DUF1206 domain-containing protein [Candidatus Dormibacteraeota bacterium]